MFHRKVCILSFLKNWRSGSIAWPQGSWVTDATCWKGLLSPGSPLTLFMTFIFVSCWASVGIWVFDFCLASYLMSVAAPPPWLKMTEGEVGFLTHMKAFAWLGSSYFFIVCSEVYHPSWAPQITTFFWINKEDAFMALCTFFGWPTIESVNWVLQSHWVGSPNAKMEEHWCKKRTCWFYVELK